MPELHPDLKACLDTVGVFEMIRHPLVVMIYHDEDFIIEQANQIFEHKKKALEEALDKAEYAKYVWLHERPYRLQAFLVVDQYLARKARLDVLREIWTDTENFWQYAEEWEGLLEEYEGKDAFKTLKPLPKEFTIYRGGSKSGLSWTLDLERAKWFARRYGKTHPLWKSVVKKRNVIAYFTDRGEEEIVILPRGHTIIEEIPFD